MRRPLSVLIVLGALVLGACSKKEPALTASPSPTPSNTVALGPSAPPAGYKALTADRAPSNAKPTVTIPSEAPPTTLQITDLTPGTGAQASATSTISVNYLLLTWEDKAEIDGSFGGQPLVQPLAGLIPGWQQGIVGMKVGGRRQLVIPPALGYGTQPDGQLGGKTLVFIIDLLAVS